MGPAWLGIGCRFAVPGGPAIAGLIVLRPSAAANPLRFEELQGLRTSVECARNIRLIASPLIIEYPPPLCYRRSD